MMIEKYYNEDKTAIGVLISPDWGSGWSTWVDKNVAIDKRVIEAWEEGTSAREMENLLKTWGYENPYVGSGYHHLKLEWIPVGQRYYISEYDGYETLIREENMEIA